MTSFVDDDETKRIIYVGISASWRRNSFCYQFSFEIEEKYKFLNVCIGTKYRRTSIKEAYTNSELEKEGKNAYVFEINFCFQSRSINSHLLRRTVLS